MFERYTERARQVIVLAQEEARNAASGKIDSVAVLLGLLREEEGLAAGVLVALGVTLDNVREAWSRYAGERLPPNTAENTSGAGQVPFTAVGKNALELALREAQSLGHNYIGTEHILLGLVRCDCEAKNMLEIEFNVDWDTGRDAIIRKLSGPGRVQKRQVVDRDQLGRLAYNLYVKALASALDSRRVTDGFDPTSPLAWEFLHHAEREAWCVVGDNRVHEHELAA